MTVISLRGKRATPALTLPLGAPNGSMVMILIPVALLLCGGLMMILSASSIASLQRYGSAFLFFTRQLAWAAVGIAALLACASIDYRVWRRAGYLLLAASAIGLVAVLIPGLGIRAGGSSRWLAIGPLRIQPSELAKLALILVGADVCVRKVRGLTTVREALLPFGVMACGIGALVLAQPDLGTTLILGLLAFVVLFVAGTSLPVIGLLGVVGAGVAVTAAMTEGYRRARIFSFLDPFGDPLNSGYQAVQSMIALGSGGLFGVGLGASRQKWLYVPNAHTDFIFAILGEETGLIGTLTVVALFVLLAYAGVRVARRAPDPFGRLVAAGITAWIIGQAVINMGAVTGILPITGVPLPLVSFGGSALVFTLAAVGIMLNIARQEVWPPPRDAATVARLPAAEPRPRRRASRTSAAARPARGAGSRPPARTARRPSPRPARPPGRRRAPAERAAPAARRSEGARAGRHPAGGRRPAQGRAPGRGPR